MSQPIPECSKTKTENFEIINMPVVKAHQSGENRIIIGVSPRFEISKQTRGTTRILWCIYS